MRELLCRRSIVGLAPCCVCCARGEQGSRILGTGLKYCRERTQSIHRAYCRNTSREIVAIAGRTMYMRVHKVVTTEWLTSGTEGGWAMSVMEVRKYWVPEKKIAGTPLPPTKRDAREQVIEYVEMYSRVNFRITRMNLALQRSSRAYSCRHVRVLCQSNLTYRQGYNQRPCFFLKL